MKTAINKPACFTDFQWKIYQTELQTFKNGKRLDVCSDCTVKYQRQMSKEGKCEFPMKRIEKLAEYA